MKKIVGCDISLYYTKFIKMFIIHTDNSKT